MILLRYTEVRARYMTLVDRKVIDDFIRKYLLLDTRIKIVKAKIKHAEYENNRFTVNKQKNILQELEQLKSDIESNINNKYLEYIKVFKMDIPESIQELNISKNNLFKLKKEIREEFIKVIDIVEAR